MTFSIALKILSVCTKELGRMRGYMILTLSISSQSDNENGNLVNLCIPRRLFGDNFVFRGELFAKVIKDSNANEDMVIENLSDMIKEGK